VKRKPDNCSELFRQTHQHLSRAEDILKSRHILPLPDTSSNTFRSTLPSLTTQLSIQNQNLSALPSHLNVSGNSSNNGMEKFIHVTPNALPLIPLSPLTSQLMMRSYQRTIALTKYNSALKHTPTPSLATLRRLVEDLRIQESSVADIAEKIQITTTFGLTHWTPQAIALQMTIIQAELFSHLNPREDLSGTGIHPHISACLDFDLYLTRVFIGTILSASHSISSSLSQSHIISHLILVGHYCLHIYRNFAGVATVVNALHSSEITRLGKAWETLVGKTRDHFKLLEIVVQETQGFGKYRQTLSLYTNSFSKGGGVLCVIPDLNPIMKEIHHINASYIAGRQGNQEFQFVLSDVGARQFESILSLLDICKGSGNTITSLSSSLSSSSSVLGLNYQSDRSEGLSIPSDLLKLGPGDQCLSHWILSRPYLSKKSLWDMSFQFEEKKSNEIMDDYPPEYEVSLGPIHTSSIPLNSNIDEINLPNPKDSEHSVIKSIPHDSDQQEPIAPSSAEVPLEERLKVDEPEIHNEAFRLEKDEPNLESKDMVLSQDNPAAVEDGGIESNIIKADVSNENSVRDEDIFNDESKNNGSKEKGENDHNNNDDDDVGTSNQGQEEDNIADLMKRLSMLRQ